MTDKTTEALMTEFLEKGGIVKVCQPGHRNKTNISFSRVRGSTSNIGRKSVTLRNSGNAKA